MTIHVHELFYAVRDGVRAHWPAERCLGDVPEAEAERILATEEPTVTPRGDLTGVTTWMAMAGSPEGCWLNDRGVVI